MKIISLTDLQDNPELLSICAENGESAVLVHHGEAKSVVLPISEALLEHGTRLSLAIHLFEAGSITLSSSAAMADIALEKFLLRLADLGVHVVRQSDADLNADLKVLGHE